MHCKRNSKSLISLFVSFFMLVNLIIFVPVTVPAATIGQVTGYVFFDGNGNGKWEDNNWKEPVLNGVRVELYKLDNSVNYNFVASMLTNSQGYYSFIGLETGKYRVKIIPLNDHKITKQGIGNNVKARYSVVNEQTGTKEIELSISSQTATVVAGLKKGDGQGPIAKRVSISSNNKNNTRLAKVGDIITLTIETNENIQNPIVKIDGINASTITNENICNATYTMKSNDKEGEIEFSIDLKDLEGNVAPTVYGTTDDSYVEFDGTLPTGTVTTNPSTWTKSDVVITLNSSDENSGIRGICKPNGEWTKTDSVKYTSFENGIYTFKVEDNAGNVATINYSIDNIDREMPSAPILNLSTEDWISGNVNASISGSSAPSGIQKYQYKIESGEWLDYSENNKPIVDKEGQTIIYARAISNAGVVGLESSKTVRIDKTLPEASVSFNPSKPTNKEVTISLTSADAGSGVKRLRRPDGIWTNVDSVNYTVYENGDYIFKIEDNCGNISIKTVNITNIDKISPKVTIDAPIMGDNKVNSIEQNNVIISGTTEPNTQVKVVITDANGKTVEKSILADVTGAYTLSRIDVSELSEGILTVTAMVTDVAGNTSMVNQEIEKDITGPAIPTLTATPTTPTNGDVTVTIHYPNDASAKQYKIGETGIWNDYKLIVINDNNTLYARCKDLAANTSEQGSLVINNIDKVSPVITIDPYTTIPTNQDITVTATTNEGTLNATSHTFTDNGVFEFIATDAAGNVSKEIITINNIDKTPPAVPILSADITTPTNGNVIVTINYPDDATVKEYKIGTSGGWVPYTGPVVVDTNCTIYAQCKDLANNTSELGSLVISNIDKTIPTAPIITLSTDEWSNKNVGVTILGSSAYLGIQKYQYKIGTSEWTDYNKLEVINEGQTIIYARAVSNTGVNGIESSKTVKIDKTAPEGTIVESTELRTDKDVDLIFSANDTILGSGVKRIKKPDGSWINGHNATYTAAESGIYTFEVEDNAGNTHTESITITNIDKATIKVGLFVNNKFSEKSSINIVKGFNVSLAFQITNLKNQQIKLEVNNTEFIRFSDVKVYATTDLKNPIKDVTVTIIGSNFIITGLSNTNSEYVVVLKATALKITNGFITDIIKINDFERDEKHFINVVKLPPLQ